MKRVEKHLFYVQSDFHYLICRSIMKRNGLKAENCYFVCHRNVRVDDDVRLYPFPIEGGLSYYFHHRKDIDSFFDNADIYTYTPFRGLFPKRKSANDNFFFEDGLASYRLKENVIKKRLSTEESGSENPVKKLLKRIMTRLVKKDSRFFLTGWFHEDVVDPQRRTLLYVCSSQAYAEWAHPFLDRIVLKMEANITEKYNVPRGSYFLVLDRFSNGCVYDVENYKKCVRMMLDYCVNRQVKEIWAKFHPADWNNKNVMKELEESAKGADISIKLFDGRLEYLAMQNINIHFISLNSTILFYAPVLGNTNRSVSFVRYMYEADDKYKSFIHLYGGIERFVEMFSENVECQ